MIAAIPNRQKPDIEPDDDQREPRMPGLLAKHMPHWILHNTGVMNLETRAPGRFYAPGAIPILRFPKSYRLAHNVKGLENRRFAAPRKKCQIYRMAHGKKADRVAELEEAIEIRLETWRIGLTLPKLRHAIALILFSGCLIVLMLVGLWPGAVSTLADAASFDCSKAKLKVETVICRDDKLSRLDEELALQYLKLRSFLSRSAKWRLAVGQRAFIGARNECEEVGDCIAQIYRIRMDELCKLGQINGHPCSVLFKTMTSKDHPQLNYCHMDECGWFVVRQKRQVAKNRAGELLELKVIDGSSEHYLSDTGQAGYPSTFDESIPIDWAAEPSTSHVFCSKILPAVIYQKEGGGIEVAPLDFGGQGIFGYNSSAAGFYVYSCYHLDPSSYTADGFAAKHGFRPLPENLKIEISKVTDILSVAEKISKGTYAGPGEDPPTSK